MKEFGDIKVSHGKQIVLERILGLSKELREFSKKQLNKLNEGGE